MEFDPLPNGRVKIGNEEYDLKTELVLVSAFVIMIGNALRETRYPEFLIELTKSNDTSVTS
jgi:hypothetical protein